MRPGNGRHDPKSLYRQLVAGLYDALLVTDPNGHLIEMNPRATEYFGYETADLWDRPVSELIPGVTAGMIRHIRSGLEASRRIMLDARCLRRDGSAFMAEVTISVIDLINVGDLVFTVRDTEGRRRKWEWLRSVSNAFSCSLTAGFVCDMERNFRAVNAAFLSMFDLPTEQAALGRKFEDLMPDEPLPAFFDQALAGETVSCRIEAKTGEGKPVEVDVKLSPDRYGQERIVGVVGSLMHL